MQPLLRRPNWDPFPDPCRPHRSLPRKMFCKLQMLSLADTGCVLLSEGPGAHGGEWEIFATSAAGHDKVCSISNGAIVLLMRSSHKASYGT